MAKDPKPERRRKRAHIERGERVFIPLERMQAARWEAFFNGDSLEARLMSRYIYEHLFFAHIYFGNAGEPHFFEMVRSRTPEP